MTAGNAFGMMQSRAKTLKALKLGDDWKTHIEGFLSTFEPLVKVLLFRKLLLAC